MQESVRSVTILPSVRSDHSPILLSLNIRNDFKKGPGMWKFNNSLLQNEEYCLQLNETIDNLTLDLENIIDPQMRWEFLKFEIRCFSIKFSKKLAKEKRIQKLTVENVVKDYESKGGDSVYGQNEYITAKNELDVIMENETKGFILRSKCLSYEQGEKSTKYFLNLEKKRAIQGTIRSLVDDNNIESKDI